MNAVTRHVLTGEVLGPGDRIDVTVLAHPFNGRTLTLSVPAGLTVGEIVEAGRAAAATPWPAEDFTVLLAPASGAAGETIEVPPERWHRVRPKPGTRLTMRVRPGFSGLIAAITSAVGAITSAIAGLGFFGKLLMGALAFGAKLLLNKLFAPKQPKQVASDAKPSYSITGSRNSATQYGAVPVILGRHRVTPPYGAAPYTEQVGTDQYLRMLFVVGYGPLDITSIKIGETPINSFEDVTYQVREGASLSETTSLYPRHVVEEPLGINLKNVDGYQRRTTGTDITEISIDIVYPNGLAWFGQDGNRNVMGSSVDWRYRKVGDVTWTQAATIRMELATQNIVRVTRRVTVAAGQYEVEVRKTSPDNAGGGGVTVIEEVHWTALRGFRVGEPVTFDKPIAVIAVRIRATSQLNGTIDTLNCIATSKVKSWNGSSWVANTKSENPADLFRHVLQGAANARPVADSAIDLTALQNWSVYCTNSGWRYDKPVLGAVAIWDLLAEICAAGRAMPIFKDGKWSVVWDEQATSPVQMFTPRNSWGFEAHQRYEVIPHCLRARFANEAKGWIEDERAIYADGYNATNATIFEGFEVPGCTSTRALWKHGRYELAQRQLRPATYSLSAQLEALPLTRGDRVLVQHDVMKVGLGAFRVKSVNAGAQTVTIDEILTLNASDSYGLRFRLSDGTFLTRNVVAGTAGELTVIPLAGSGSLPVAGDLGTFGLVGADTVTYRVLGVEPQADGVHELTLVDDAPDIYLADTGAIPDWDSGITEPVDPFTLPPLDVRVTGDAYEEGGQFFEFIAASWTLPRLGKVTAVQVEWKEQAEGVWHPTANVAPEIGTTIIRRLNSGVYTVRARCVFSTGHVSAWTSSAAYDATSLLDPPADVTNFRIVNLGDVSTLSWDAVAGRAGITYQVRFAPSTVVSPSWNSAPPLLPSIDATSAQVPTMIGTYFIKAQLPSGLASANAVSIVTNIGSLAGLNVVATITESPGFGGTKTGVEVINGELRLAGNATLATWETLDTVISLAVGDGADDALGYVTSGTYQFAGSLDLGAVYTSRLTASVDAYGFDPADTMANWLHLSDVSALDTASPDSWSVELQFRTTQVDPALNVWSAWQSFVAGDATARAFQFRLLLTGKAATNAALSYALTTPSVRALSVKVDMPDRTIAGNDIAVGTGGLTVSFSPAFRHLDGLAIAAQNMATGDRAAITAKSEAGFTIQFFDSGGSPVARTFDYVAKGYGVVG